MFSSYQKIPTTEIRSYANKLQGSYQQERNTVDGAKFPCGRKISESQSFTSLFNSVSSSNNAPQTLHCGYKFEDNTSAVCANCSAEYHHQTSGDVESLPLRGSAEDIEAERDLMKKNENGLVRFVKKHPYFSAFVALGATLGAAISLYKAINHEPAANDSEPAPEGQLGARVGEKTTETSCADLLKDIQATDFDLIDKTSLASMLTSALTCKCPSLDAATIEPQTNATTIEPQTNATTIEPQTNATTTELITTTAQTNATTIEQTTTTKIATTKKKTPCDTQMVTVTGQIEKGIKLSIIGRNDKEEIVNYTINANKKGKHINCKMEFGDNDEINLIKGEIFQNEGNYYNEGDNKIPQDKGLIKINMAGGNDLYVDSSTFETCYKENIAHLPDCKDEFKAIATKGMVEQIANKKKALCDTQIVKVQGRLERTMTLHISGISPDRQVQIVKYVINPDTAPLDINCKVAFGNIGEAGYISGELFEGENFFFEKEKVIPLDQNLINFKIRPENTFTTDSSSTKTCLKADIAALPYCKDQLQHRLTSFLDRKSVRSIPCDSRIQMAKVQGRMEKGTELDIIAYDTNHDEFFKYTTDSNREAKDLNCKIAFGDKDEVRFISGRIAKQRSFVNGGSREIPLDKGLIDFKINPNAGSLSIDYSSFTTCFEEDMAALPECNMVKTHIMPE